MTKISFYRLPLGVYRIWWTRGGNSLSSLGKYASGVRWLAPVKWIRVCLSVDSDGFLLQGIWNDIKKMTLIKK